jgi:hypothetical protein
MFDELVAVFHPVGTGVIVRIHLERQESQGSETGRFADWHVVGGSDRRAGHVAAGADAEVWHAAADALADRIE